LKGPFVITGESYAVSIARIREVVHFMCTAY
jgi:chemotaxis signal transduction protein